MTHRFIFVSLALLAVSLGCAPAQTDGPVEISEEEAEAVMNEVNAAGTQEEQAAGN